MGSTRTKICTWRMDPAQDHFGGASGTEGSKFMQVDLTKGLSAIKVVRWTSAATPTGVSGAPTLATAEKGCAIVEGAAAKLADFARGFRTMS